MLLNLEIIQDYLPEIYQTKLYGPSNHSCTVSRPLLYESGQVFQEDTLYLAAGDALPKEPPSSACSFIVAGSRIPKDWLLGGVSLLVISNTSNVLRVFNAVSMVYNAFDRWDEQLRDELEKDIDFDIRRIFYLGALQLKKNISMMNRSLQSIFRAVIEIRPDGSPEIRISDTPQYIDWEWTEKIKEVCNLERIITVPYLSEIKGTRNRYYCYNIYSFGNFSGCISFGEEAGSFRDSDFSLMDHFFGYFQKAYEKYLHSCAKEDNSSLNALHKMLDNIPVSQEALLPLTLHSDEKWCFFRLKENRKVKNMPRDYMYSVINGIMPRAVYPIIYHEEIVGLIRLQKGKTEELFSLFERTLYRMGYFGGISNSFADFSQLHDYFIQASYAADHGNTDGFLHYFRDHALEYMLSSCTGELSTASLLSHGLTALLEYDEKKGTDYANTLRLYLENEMSVTKTSQMLFIHRSSLMKRLDKIQKILRSDLEDGKVRLYYRICLELIRQ